MSGGVVENNCLNLERKIGMRKLYVLCLIHVCLAGVVSAGFVRENVYVEDDIEITFGSTETLIGFWQSVLELVDSRPAGSKAITSLHIWNCPGNVLNETQYKGWTQPTAWQVELGGTGKDIYFFADTDSQGNFINPLTSASSPMQFGFSSTHSVMDFSYSTIAVDFADGSWSKYVHIPEPASVGLLAIGVLGLIRRKQVAKI